jgi:hypothetical protein
MIRNVVKSILTTPLAIVAKANGIGVRAATIKVQTAYSPLNVSMVIFHESSAPYRDTIDSPNVDINFIPMKYANIPPSIEPIADQNAKIKERLGADSDIGIRVRSIDIGKKEESANE